MTPICSRCREVVDPHDRMCAECGADLHVTVPELVDLTVAQVRAERRRAQLLAAVVAADADPAPSARPTLGVNSRTMLDLELGSVRVGRFHATDDLLPAPATSKRGRRRR
jgi:hypothetical protein